MCTSDKEDVEQGFGTGTAAGTGTLTEYFEPLMVCALEANGILEWNGDRDEDDAIEEICDLEANRK